jgi:DNA-binding transcriptional LysR family regulator
VLPVDRMLTNINLVAAGMGVSVAPASLRVVQAGQVAYCPILDRPPRVAPLTLLHPADAPDLTQRFAAMARAAAPASGTGGT